MHAYLRRCRTASNSTMPAAIDTFRESDRPACGMEIFSFAEPSMKSLRPSFSEPSSRALGPRQSTSQKVFVAAGEVASERIPLDCIQATASAEAQTATGIENTAPWEERTTLGLKRSVMGSQTIKASQPAESAVRNKAPRLPGFSTDSATRSRGFAESCRRLREQSQVWAMPRSPSGPSRPLIFSKAERPTSQQSMPAERQPETSSAASTPRNNSGQK